MAWCHQVMQITYLHHKPLFNLTSLLVLRYWDVMSWLILLKVYLVTELLCNFSKQLQLPILSFQLGLNELHFCSLNIKMTQMFKTLLFLCDVWTIQFFFLHYLSHCMQLLLLSSQPWMGRQCNASSSVPSLGRSLDADGCRRWMLLDWQSGSEK